uniref:ankyrin repeat-containing protein ITN1-like n=1 Tax=Erigeron canadensis TaxID=72917 RepID=UPI001CB96F82|nr:ankyrin repeat-containing protein ITN1-like [Erigeron canadensis]
MNEIGKHGMVEGVPMKRFEMEDKCVPYLKGKQQKSAHKPKQENSIASPFELLHMDLFCPVNARSIGMAHEIAIKHKRLIHEKDEGEMTPLQLLSCRQLNLFPKRYITRKIYNLIDPNVEDTSRMLSFLKKMRKNKFRYEWGMKLIKLLVKEDTSWENTEERVGKHRVKFHEHGKKTSTIQAEKTTSIEVGIRLPHTPLLLATKHGCTEIVEEILQQYPQAIEHIDQDSRNILHVAIMNRNHEVFELLMNKKYTTERLRGKIDNDANTLLHMVAKEILDVDAELRGPAFVLQDNIRMFKKVEGICTTLDRMKRNSKSKTAEEVFNEHYNQLRADAKEWMLENSKNYTVVAVLIATVAFAAAYTVPGGLDPNTGQPVLKKTTFFFYFTVADVVSLSATLTSVIMFLNIIILSYRFKDFEKSLICKMNSGHTMLMISVAMLMVEFAVTLILTITSGREWTAITLYAVSFFPVHVFIFSYFEFQKIQLLSPLRKSKHII